jgi:hypothetical protein
LLKAAYGEDPTGLQSRLGAIAQALNSGDFATAMIAAVHTRTPELSPEAAARLANAEAELAKYITIQTNREIGMAAGPGADLLIPGAWRYLKSRTISVGRSMSRWEMTLCVALLKTHALLNVRNPVFQRITMAGSSSTV